MSKEKPNNYPSEFKESSVKLALESDQSMAQTARDLGVNPNTLYGWVSQYSQSNTSQCSAIRTDEHLYDELKRLKKENARLKEERDILKNVWSAPNLQDLISDRIVFASMYPACL